MDRGSSRHGGWQMDRPRLLLVEDDGMACSLMQNILADQGLTVMTARTVAEGLALLESRPDYLILDLNLPDGDGRVVLEGVRRAGLPTRVVVTSGCGAGQAVQCGRVAERAWTRRLTDALAAKPWGQGESGGLSFPL